MKKLTVVVTVDDKMGIAFNKRRQSRDRLLIEDLCKKSEGNVYLSGYSAPLFKGYENRIRIVSDPIKDSPDGGVCFVETTSLAEYTDDISTLIVYHWNRLYPSDKKLDISIGECGFKLSAKYDFAGSSHDQITKEVYQK